MGNWLTHVLVVNEGDGGGEVGDMPGSGAWWWWLTHVLVENEGDGGGEVDDVPGRSSEPSLLLSRHVSVTNCCLQPAAFFVHNQTLPGCGGPVTILSCITVNLPEYGYR